MTNATATPTELPDPSIQADTSTQADTGNQPDANAQAVAEGGAYEVLRRRLGALAKGLEERAANLNARRLAEFGDSRMNLLGRIRIMTEQNSVGRDIVQVGGLLLFGFNVSQALRAEVRLEDVFGLYRLVGTENQYDVEPVPAESSFLADPTFRRDFEELYAYYRHARLLQLTRRGDRLLAAFQVGERSSDMRVFRWAVSPGGQATYMDARGSSDLTMPPPFDFSWTRASREMEVSGRFPHLNILGTIFVDMGRGRLTIKTENDTETGEGIYSEPVEDSTQSLDDAQIEFARVGSLILLRVLPYREKEWRGLIYNTLTRRVTRMDALTQACIQLPEDHGLLFPGGYYLQGGEYRAFDASMDGMQFEGMQRSPNGEDVLYSFYEHEEGLSALFVYNLIARELQSPIFAHGHALLPDGRMVLFHDEGSEATRVHPMQVWQTPFVSDEYAASRPPSTTELGKLGNAALVRGISDLYQLARDIENPEVSAQRYQALTSQTRKLFDQHHWFAGAVSPGLGDVLHEVSAASENILDEFEKVQAMQQQARSALAMARAEQRQLLASLQPEEWQDIQPFVDALGAITAQRGRLLTVREQRYVDTAAIDAMSAELQEAQTRIGTATGEFLAGPDALRPLAGEVSALSAQAEAAKSARELGEVLGELGSVGAGLDTLSELLTRLPVDDAAQRTRVLEGISGIYANLNALRAGAEQRRKALGEGEAAAQFSAQFALFSQSIASALSLTDTPEKADEQLARLLVALEDLEGQFGEHETFLGDILSKREELRATFEAHRQALLDDRQRRAQALLDAAGRILSGLTARSERLKSADELNAFYAGDPLILKLRELAARLRDLHDNVRADDIEAQLKAARDAAMRSLRDRSDLFEEGGNVIKLGPRHRFSVNTQPLDLTLLPRGDELNLHLTGTDFFEPLHDPVLDGLRDFWPVTLDSESPDIYRGEFLASQVWEAARHGEESWTLAQLQELLQRPADLEQQVRAFAGPRYREGYQKGVHDHDAALILRALLPVVEQAGPLLHPPQARALALLAWVSAPDRREGWAARFRSAQAVQKLFGTADTLDSAIRATASELEQLWQGLALEVSPEQAQQAAQYLAEEIGAAGTGISEGEISFTFTRTAAALIAALDEHLQAGDMRAEFDAALAQLATPAERWTWVQGWLGALVTLPQWVPAARFVPEAAALRVFGAGLPHQIKDLDLTLQVSGLLGDHPRIQGGTLTLGADEALARWQAHRESFVPAFHRYQARRQEVMQQQREALRLDEFRARPLTSFVRNRLINDVYLPLIGDNLAKQMGTAGEGKRSDLMGLLMLISPPGYGKTTLMEYVAYQLGLVFMKINGPALGHAVRSLDPAQALDATARQELEKLNLALEMGNNVMLYLDDIQHTSPEFLQKFISLTDGSRRIEGVWQGKTRTYDLRGKKFAVVMAGNPYTESGEVFKIPDMLANRADIYNLGDVLGGREDDFLLSYLENSLTSSAVLAPLATRDIGDLYTLIDRASGKDVSTATLSYSYAPAEVAEIVATLERLIKIRDVLACVNAQYIASAAQAGAYRTEPPFRLQGSYRNMTKLAEKVSALMNDAELEQLITDHYVGEAQLLTSGAEENLLKLAELRGTLTPEQAARWEQIKADFRRNKAMGGDETDTGGRVVAQLADIASGLEGLRPVSPAPATAPAMNPDALAEALSGALARSLEPVLAQLAQNLQEQSEPQQEAVRAVIAPLLAGIATSSQRQDELNRAVHGLVDLLHERQEEILKQRRKQLDPVSSSPVPES